ncbi:MAG: ABC transporter permease subunit [Desulfitobacteriaceae bacterium]|nr:ABC transporter permease subunit [Desulfitobacteriaceae bacterium]
MISTMLDKRRVEKAASIVFALIVWQMFATLLDKSLLLVTPIAVVQRLISLSHQADFLSTIAFSFVRIVFGYLLALAAGSVLAVIAGRFYLAEIMFLPFITAIKSVPVASFIILCLIWLSSQGLSVFISFLIVLPIVYTNMLQGIKSTDTKLLEMAELFRVGWFKKMKYIYLPELKPYLISACSVSIGLSWKAGIAAEVIGIPDGSIGEKLYEAKVYLSSGDLFAWTAVIIVVSIAFEKLFLYLLKWVFLRLERS